MNRILFILAPLIILFVLSNCITTNINTVDSITKKDAIERIEICELKQVKPIPYKYIWLIDKNMPLPKVKEIVSSNGNEKNDLAELKTKGSVPPKVDSNGLPLPEAPIKTTKIVKKTEKPEPEKISAKIEPKKSEKIPEPKDSLNKVNNTIETKNTMPAPRSENTIKENPVEAEEALYGRESKSDEQLIKKRNICARQGDDIEIVFNKPGWIFLGYSFENNSEGLKYLAKGSKEGKTLFNFKALQLGDYNLDFQLQDNISGAAEKEYITVKVVTEEEFTSFLKTNENANTLPVERDFSFADKLFELGQYQNALSEYLKLYEDGDFFLNNRLATIYFTLNDYRKAIYFWKKNLDAKQEFFKEAVDGLANAYIRTDDYNALVSHLRYLLDFNNLISDKELLVLAKYFKSRNSDKLALDLLFGYLQYSPYGKHADEVYYLLATILEKDTDFRNLKESRNYYQKVISEYPESLYADASIARVNYLNQHFFYVR